eukprot:SAG11_NODE_275_length_11309_cov_6.090901_13_plen_85_part_00
MITVELPAEKNHRFSHVVPRRSAARYRTPGTAGTPRTAVLYGHMHIVPAVQVLQRQFCKTTSMLFRLFKIKRTTSFLIISQEQV